MKEILKIKFGAHLYGTNTPNSDLDYKSIFIPDGRDIILQRVKDTINDQRSKGEGEKNFAGEIDEEAYSLQKFLKLCSEGQTVALDILFAPPSALVNTVQIDPKVWNPNSDYWSDEWEMIQANRHRLLTSQSASFIGYCRTQANKYGIKGSRVGVVQDALILLENFLYLPTRTKLKELNSVIKSFIDGHKEHTQLLDIPGPKHLDGSVTIVKHWEVCNRKLPYTQTIKECYEVLTRLDKEYGHRAKLAQTQEGVDWKALSHAVRVGRQAIELLETGNIIFPLQYATYLKEVKLGQIPYQKVAEEIEELLEQVEKAAEVSSLPVKADKEWIDEFIYKCYKKAVNDCS